MKIKNVNRFKVNYFIEKSGMKKCEIAESIGIKKWSLSYRIAGRVNWELEELKRLAILLNFELSDVVNI